MGGESWKPKGGRPLPNKKLSKKQRKEFNKEWDKKHSKYY